MIFRKLLWLPRMDEYTMVVNDDGEEVPGILFNLELITASDVSDPVRCFRVEKKISDYAQRLRRVEGLYPRHMWCEQADRVAAMMLGSI